MPYGSGGSGHLIMHCANKCDDGFVFPSRVRGEMIDHRTWRTAFGSWTPEIDYELLEWFNLAFFFLNGLGIKLIKKNQLYIIKNHLYYFRKEKMMLSTSQCLEWHYIYLWDRDRFLDRSKIQRSRYIFYKNNFIKYRNLYRVLYSKIFSGIFKTEFHDEYPTRILKKKFNSS